MTALRAYLCIGAPVAVACALALSALGQAQDPRGSCLHAIVITVAALTVAAGITPAITYLLRRRP